jgi:hypothetical protein
MPFDAVYFKSKHINTPFGACNKMHVFTAMWLVHFLNGDSSPMSLVQQPEPFDDPDWIYGIKHDGFRALAVIEQGHFRGEGHRRRRAGRYGSPRTNDVHRLNAVAQRRRLATAALTRQKRKIKRILASCSPHILYGDHTRGSGIELYRLV